MFYNVCEAETNENAQTCDDIIEKSKASVETFDNILEEHDGHELEQNENHIAEKTDEYLDYISYQEFKGESSCDDNVVEEIDSINDLSASDIDADDLREVKSDDLADLGSDDTGFGQHEIEENDVKSESSSGTMHHMKLEEVETSQEPMNETAKEYEIKESEKDYSRRIAEMTAKRNRLAVERAVHEAHEQAFSEACERAKRERVAVEKATKENRPQKLLLGLNHHLSEVLHGRSVEQKRRAERAAVERATLEAQQRALEKEVSQKTVVI
ncbi:DnaJ domain-containing protein [Artemisia annua]|uniref:DnaJ domain-containing protein n=1 Tax=Artemisia annua TaxID=35608 RepID=A0A2U1MFR9_ARTAN|nr:DnaJ domain-containing protein [Artemisia annua]